MGSRAQHLQLDDGEHRPRALEVGAVFWRCKQLLQSLVAPLSLQGPTSSAPTEEAIRQVFQGLAREAVERRQQRLSMGIQVSGPRANREALYLAPQRVSWEQSIRSFLDRSTAYEGCDREQLQRLVALQHFLEVDVADLHLPAEQRCSEDQYFERAPLEDVCMQFLMDVTRGVYILEGSRYEFEEVLAKSGLNIEEESLLVEQLKEDFSHKVAADLRRRLVESSAGKLAENQAGYNVLVRGATSLLSQSGLANVERACDAQLVVSGGDQELIFELKRAEDEAESWDFILTCEKTNFNGFMSTEGGETRFFHCSSNSRIFRSAVVRMTVEEKYPPLSIEVLELRSETELLDEMDQPISWHRVEDRRLVTVVKEILGSMDVVRTLASLPVRLLQRCWTKAQQTFQSAPREGELPLYDRGGIELHSHT
ncbi:unnamed protein product [Cladocopium goreaui]|uniref:Uncharacterized protein n=1 Tax=Cladocopium goreaui TaxID=2562237 RepID=A0A9P1FFF3_9DINO|nr:unnamed protein product [Cladocopium goreaui]